MYHVKSKLRTFLIVVFSSLCLIATTLGLVACGEKDLKIDVPERIEADLGTGTYVVPRYDVVNESGVIMAGYTVRLKSATDPNGEAAEIAREASTIVTLSGAGEYTFVYTADSKKVPDATVIMDFADRTAPTISLSSSLFPAFYIKGVTYSVPEYTLSGDYVASKCYTKVFYNSGTGDDVEVPMDSGNYTVEHATGKYTVLIHVEDAAGNSNDYRYTRSVEAPENYDPQTVIYFNEAFGEKQVAPDGDYAGQYVSVADGGKAYGDEAGSYKVVFDGSETTNNEAYFALNVPAITNIMEYKELEMYVYIEDDECSANAEKWVVGSKWWNDTQVKVGEWTRVTWSVDNWGNGVGANSGATTTNVISTENITGTRIRLIPDGDYSDKTPPHGAVYFSAMRVVPHTPSQITAGENVTLNKRDGNYHVGETVTLTANEIEGKSFDCFLVDGTPIGGNTFVVEKESYTVEAKYVDGALTAGNMTWGTTDSYTTEGTDAKSYKLGTGTHWVLTYQPELEETGWVYTAAYVGGKNQLFGIEMHSDTDVRKLFGYGGNWKGMDEITLSQEVSDALRASKTEPVTLIYVRNGETIYVYLQQNDAITFLGAIDFSVFEVSGNDFGIGERAGEIKNAALKNIKWIVGEERTNIYLESLAVSLELTNVTAEKENYILGDTVTLTAAEAPAGKMFAYFTVDGEKVAGDTFVATKFNHEVAAVYAEISTLTLGDGVTTSNGNTQAGIGSTVTLVFNGTAPSGKYFIGFKVDGSEIEGNTFEATASAHTVEAVFADCIQTGSHQLNEVSKVQGADDYVKQHNLTNAEFVTDFAYSGEDGAVLRDGVLKVTVSGGEASVALKNAKVSSLQNYKSFYYYVYTVAAGTKSGGWWCNDTVLTPGKWTKVEFTREFAPQNTDEISVWVADSINEFYYRFMGGSDGTVFYVTAIYGVPYADVEVTVETSVQEYVTVSGTYKEGQEITLSVNGAPAGKKFAYFTINDERYDGTTYTLGTQNVTVGAVFTEVSTLTLADGIATADGATEYGRSVNVTLIYNGTVPAGKVFDCFTVDGVKVNGNTFTTSAAEHSVGVVFVDNAADMTWTTASAEGAVSVNAGEGIWAKKLGNSETWVMRYTVTNLPSGDWGQLTAVYLGATSQIVSLQFSGSTYTFGLYGGPVWSGSVTVSNDIAAVVKGASTENPVTLTFVKSGNDLTGYAALQDGTMYKIGTLDLSTYASNANATTDFGYAYRDPHFGAPTLNGDIEFVTGEGKVGLYTHLLKANISYTKASASEQKDYFIGDTVTLTHDAAETGYAFSHYTVDGTAISGDSFVVTKLSHTVEAVYDDLTNTYYIDVASANVLFAENGLLTLPVATVKDGNGDTVSGYTITATVTDAKGNTYTVSDGVAELGYKGALNLTIEYSCMGLSGKEAVLTCMAQGKDGTVLEANEFGASLVTPDSAYAKVEYSTEQKYGTDEGAIKITTLGAKGNQDYAYFKFEFAGYDYVEFYAYTTGTGKQIGGWWYGDTNLTANTWTKVRLALHSSNVDEANGWRIRLMGIAEGDVVYLSSMKLCKFDYTQAVLDVSKGTTKGEWTTEKCYDGNDVLVDKTGTLKLTPDSADYYGIKVNAEGINVWDIQDNYSEVYFYVYTDATGAQGSVTWAADTPLTAGQWTKVTVFADKFGNLSGANTNMALFSFRIIGGNGGTFYVTSLYGVPKTAD